MVESFPILNSMVKMTFLVFSHSNILIWKIDILNLFVGVSSITI